MKGAGKKSHKIKELRLSSRTRENSKKGSTAAVVVVVIVVVVGEGLTLIGAAKWATTQ